MGNRWSSHPSGISTSSSVGIGTTSITSTLTVKGDGIVDGTFQIGLDAATTATLNLTSNSSLSYGGNNLTLRNDRTSGRVVLMGDNGVEILNHDTDARGLHGLEVELHICIMKVILSYKQPLVV